MRTKKTKAGPADVHLGNALRVARMEAAVSQGKLAAHVGVSVQQWSKYELGIDRVSASQLHRIAQSLQLKVDDFFSEKLPENTVIVSKLSVQACHSESAQRHHPRKVTIHRRTTSIRFDSITWKALSVVAAQTGRSINDVCAQAADSEFGGEGLARAVRNYVLNYFMTEAAKAGLR